ncbi:hypothetical protein ORIO_00500 [Cereibacter azotoformans]|uniref:hypothetical protein n=1 Tax=Cereibacter azotoformans TaxID=43057 RepID=UPI00126659A9|nr:hypothetical protein [Cereibacter azotoformans]ULB08421.1 hypothetical protein ORIO_00500 [Cereibacter azotoformans]
MLVIMVLSNQHGSVSAETVAHPGISQRNDIFQQLRWIISNDIASTAPDQLDLTVERRKRRIFSDAGRRRAIRRGITFPKSGSVETDEYDAAPGLGVSPNLDRPPKR